MAAYGPFNVCNIASAACLTSMCTELVPRQRPGFIRAVLHAQVLQQDMQAFYTCCKPLDYEFVQLELWIWDGYVCNHGNACIDNLLYLSILLVLLTWLHMYIVYIHWLARDLGWAGGSHCLSLDRNLSMPLEPKLAPCGWRCPHRRPALTGSFGNW